MKNINTKTLPTWCPGCFNFQILAGVKNFLNKQIKNERDRENYAIVTGIGCASKIFDYVNLNGLNGLHGRVVPTCLGIKIGNPNLKVLGFAGDGDAYSEGVEHLVHACRYNSDFKYIVHNNQVFALTVGQPTAVSELGFVDKTTPAGVKINPLNPIKLVLASGATFVARVLADVKQVEWVLEEAAKHRGFAFIEVVQPCIIFHPDSDYKKHVYDLQESGHDKTDWKKAIERALEFDYNKLDDKTRIPMGIFYQKQEETFEEKFPALTRLKRAGKGWRDIKR
ncbi:MAG: 2-oxoacid:ferredoxin oxidoreductase subunit beta [Nanoarchaeota archaeon]|nr:2-oxoacid:ferredoxin oxidoreductase subunit beta [Nanoarchaeota archaeon]MBU4086560.1 2-oxoacid:ferredoxin oxidoreductase subunit beta [Nanoarchaeota archaeon]